MSQQNPDLIDVATAYDNVAELYTRITADLLASNPFDRAMLTVFAELVRGNGSGPVADLGCGPGRLTGHLAELGLDVFGIDLSPQMIELARQAHPTLRFDEGSMESLALADASLAGIVAWYSIIHLTPDRVPDVLAELHRVLRPEGHALLAFFGADAADVAAAFDHKVVRAYRWAPDRLAELLVAQGFSVVLQSVRAPLPEERFTQGYLLVSKDR
ncbi:class I SAM-dependent methyltransferase [Nocardia sp. NPDC052566]|uniref:class I SAM-dependent methyltransferase n=1 Tax=Nocardia sp. NPDC052566 TaxID=3364330 RepID=UPI0037C5E882